ncbi:D-2-hydroxyacid dehydrogenase [Apilactobacillus micheneri]|uniref:D-2-hydroxyacid dehydrogenase n=2 Tax=Apilactobacillus micheneri TaxID=1899430 RepID=A0ABY2YYT1_9LACO|nr:D-2-hydroxyacid dehydrogenase [Apilactobacillus micheneri]TPR26436.1 D-2-hydroxyacid dehydrogenase [Apilactobacillus micheneri]TPR27190.1 D-2-hydroxyacid dehydrogenase [Apilactobacillus micheneri]TPR27437.1 D-2-hydroxyacid dehydrogenase [Apilactobacillus micheneri]TPR31953.1 D-2-hydroxyacid dehydrogenase [Apilactobacillus micheneri]TPR32357.1 D-2-hydroxyacid dehydrogenase [Apilactobacillus micheneri]
MKLLMYSIREDELDNLKEIEQKYAVKISTTDKPLNVDTVDLAKGFDGITVQQHGNIDDDIIYQKLHDFGIKQISLRITGYEIINFAAAKKYDLKITNVPAYSPRSVSELVLADVMSLLRHLRETHLREDNADFAWNGLQAREIHNLTVGIIGAGKIGSAVARIFKALGSKVLVSDPVKRPELFDTVEYVDYDTLLTKSDIVTMHTPMTDFMHHFMNIDRFKQMKKDAIFINASRGPVVDTKDLIAALNDNEIAAAAVDTFEGEAGITGVDLSKPGFENEDLSELLKMPNVIVTPHIGFYTDAAVKNMDMISSIDSIKIVKGEEPLHLVK